MLEIFNLINNDIFLSFSSLIIGLVLFFISRNKNNSISFMLGIAFYISGIFMLINTKFMIEESFGRWLLTFVGTVLPLMIGKNNK